ncbi:MAG: single-stranded DNA-binding protein [Ruminococcaceae bacterium]|nr:single-stranded DNA-binding protein [Oscillospiraceae bacterium]
MEHIVNQITVRGELVALPEFSHENHGRRFYRFYLDVPRLSGNNDRLPVIISEQLLNTLDPSAGEYIKVIGQVRSHNIRSANARHLLIFIFAISAAVENGDACNDVILEGPLCKDPIYRRTPLGREICDVMLAVPRTFRRADYLPCIFWGRTAQDISACRTGDRIRMTGRLQSRTYTKRTETGSEERIAYEISALSAEILDEPNEDALY